MATPVRRPLAAAALAAALAACAHVPPPPTQKDIEKAEIHYDLGANAVANGRPQEALKEFLEAERLNPYMPEPHNALGLLYHWSYRRLDDAKKQLEKAVELRPEYPEAWNNLGALKADLGDVAGAKVAFEKALADPLYKTPHIAQANLGWVLHLQGQSRQGKEMVAAALEVKPEYCMGHRTMARIFEAEGRAQDAEGSWLLFAKHCPDEPEALFRLGSIQAKKQEHAAASRSFLKCIEKGGARPVAGDCRSSLATLPPLPDEPPPAPPAGPAGTDPGASVDGARDLETPR